MKSIITLFVVAILLSGFLSIEIDHKKVANGQSEPWIGVDEWTMDMNISDLAGATFVGEMDADHAGSYIASGGDVNGDGIDDFLIGAYQNSENGIHAGKVYLFFGKSDGWEFDLNVSNADASFLGEFPGDGAGFSLSCGGDVNGDGFEDIIIGAYENSENGDSTGQVYVIFGKSTGWSRDLILSNADASFLGEENYDRAGYSVSNEGDVNGDGYDDILIGAPWSNYEGSNFKGETHLIFGKENGWGMDVELSSFGVSFHGLHGEDYSGYCVSIVGDMNRDGYDDIMSGAIYGSGMGGRSGETYLIFGKETGWETNMLLEDADASFWGEGYGDHACHISRAGDVNGDGFDDILISSGRNSEGGTNAGQTYLILGKKNGWVDELILSDADASFMGEAGGDQSGYWKTAGGDVNGDGYSDILIGAHGSDESGENIGQAYVIFGKSTGWSMDTNLTDSDASFIGEFEGDFLGDIVSAGGDLNGDGSDELIISATGNDDVRNNSGKVYVIFGETNTEPLEVYSVDIYSDPVYSEKISSSDKGVNVFIELIGLDGNASHQDTAMVNVSYKWSPKLTIGIPLRETNLNSGIYRGLFRITEQTTYMDVLTFESRKDPTKKATLFIEPQNRPSSISELELFSDETYGEPWDKFDRGERVYVQVTGVDTDPSSRNLAFTNSTMLTNSSFRLFTSLLETDLNTGIYRGSYSVPFYLEFFDNITVASCKDEAVSKDYMIHTHVQIRPLNDISTTYEDDEYRSKYWNFGYEAGTFELYQSPAWMNWDPVNYEMFGTPDNNHVGKWDVGIRLSDVKGHSDVHEFQISVINNPAEIITEDVPTAYEKSMYLVDYNSSDDGQGNINWYLWTVADWLSINSSTGELSGEPLNEDVGEWDLTITVNDGYNDTIRSLTVQVIGINDPPQITNMDIPTGRQGELYYRDYEVHDRDGDTEFVWTLITNSSFLSIDNKTGVLQGTPGQYDVGIFMVNVTVTDPGGLSDSHVFFLNIEDVNDRPFWIDVPADVLLDHGDLFYFDVNAGDPDIGNVLEYSVETIPESDLEIDPISGIINWTAAAKWVVETNDELDIHIKVSDGSVFLVHSFTITIIPSGSPSVSLTGPPIGSRTPSTNTVLTWTASDPENDPLMFDIYLHENQAFIEGMREEALYIEGHLETTLDLTEVEMGKRYYWMVRPHDGCLFGPSSITGKFKVNHPPSLSFIPPQTAETGSEFKLKISGSDKDPEDHSNFIYTLVSFPEGMTINENTGLIKWTPKDDQIMMASITVEVSDGIETDSRTFEIEVTEGEKGISSLLLIILTVAVIVILIATVIFFIFSLKKRREEEALRREEEKKAALEREREEEYASYEDLYGVPAPVEEEELTARELKEAIHEQIEELEEIQE